MTKEIFTNFLNEDDPQWKMISKYYNENISTISGQILPKFETWAYMTIPYFVNNSNEDNLQWKTTYKYLKEYLSNHILDPNQILNFCLNDQTMLYNDFKWKTTSK